MTLADIVGASRQVGETASRLGKIAALAHALRAARGDEIPLAVLYLSGAVRQPRLGIGGAALASARRQAAPTPHPLLTLQEVDAALARIAALSGARATSGRIRLLGELFAQATTNEQDFLVRLLSGELRQGAVEGMMIEAVAAAGGAKPDALRRAVMVTGDLAGVAEALLSEGTAALARFGIAMFRPLRPMLACSAEDPAAALTAFGEAAFEFKMDGARVQVHKAGSDVRVFSRRLNEVTGSVPEIVEAARALPVTDIVLDGEAIAFGAGGSPQPFQMTMRRFGRRLDVEAAREALPLRGFFFDCLRLDGEDLTLLPAHERVAALAAVAPPALLVPRCVTSVPAVAEGFLAEALRSGHEGVMAKAPDSVYTAGARGAEWLKIKRAKTLDLVVLAAEWGNGRRRGWLSNLHLGARDTAAGGFVMLGKTFKGMTDAVLGWQTERLLQLEVARDGAAVFVRAELVAEIAFSDIQASPRYPGGLALRFARLRRYRQDKAAADADTIDTVRALYAAQHAHSDAGHAIE